MKARICDRCGKRIGWRLSGQGTSLKHQRKSYVLPDSYDLCQRCSGSFELFMAGRLVAAVEKEGE